ncbi:Androgen-induced gene 1 protein [Araneus ventricosus]|uniref:Androgen-induced gene 1 protein n=1 Tax=Araneus ventricosus TaxID=182803 RepID=A0A4Y2KBK4_ARAVE|nr:Androgen-induced gene 1 protein [Araneus ventricosus]
MNTKSMVRLLFHLLISVAYFCALIGYQLLPPMPHKRPHEHFAGRFKYLTYWNLIAHFVFFAVSCILDVMKTSATGFFTLAKIKDKLFVGIVLPYGVFVVGMFWGLYAIDRELIFPKVLDAVFPCWLNHVSHTVILPALLIETYIVKHRHPRRTEGLMYTAGFGLAYMIWVLYLALVMNIWVYPVLQVLNWTQKFIFFGICVLIQFSMYIIGEKINYMFWGGSIMAKNK